MAKIFDITEKLKFNEKPVLKLYDRNITIENSAERVLAFIDESRAIAEDPSALQRTAKLLFNEKDWKFLIKELKLNMEDLSTVISAAISLAQGNEPDFPGDEAGF